MSFMRVLTTVSTVVMIGGFTITGVKWILNNLDVDITKVNSKQELSSMFSEGDRTTPELPAIADLGEPNTYFCWRYWGGCR